MNILNESLVTRDLSELNVPKIEWKLSATAEKRTRSVVDLKFFLERLRATDVCETRNLGIAGSVIFLPYGCSLLANYRGIVSQSLREFNFQEYDYPIVASSEIFSEAGKVLNLRKRLLHCGDMDDFEAKSPRATLIPTGEAIIYTHWKTLVKSYRSLPLRIFQHTKYIRPQSKQNQNAESIFKPVENSDVFEYHAAFRSFDDCSHNYDALLNLNSHLMNKFHLPVLRSRRPLWTNRSEVSLRTTTDDVVFSTGKTLQVSCLYLQSNLFSAHFNINYVDESGKKNLTHHIAGAVSRRLLLSHLFIGLRADGTFLIHPDLAATHVKLFYIGTEEQKKQVDLLTAQIKELGMRINVESLPNGDNLKQLLANSKSNGTPVTLVVQAKRHTNDKNKLILYRNDTQEESVAFSDSIDPEIAIDCLRIVDATGAAFTGRARDVLEQQVVKVSSLDEAKEVLKLGKIADVPLRECKEDVLVVASWKLGEVLGFYDEEVGSNSNLLDRPITRAYISRRI